MVIFNFFLGLSVKLYYFILFLLGYFIIYFYPVNIYIYVFILSYNFFYLINNILFLYLLLFLLSDSCSI